MDLLPTRQNVLVPGLLGKAACVIPDVYGRSLDPYANHDGLMCEINQ